MTKIKKTSNLDLDPKNSAIDNFLYSLAKNKIEAAGPPIPSIEQKVQPRVQAPAISPQEAERRKREFEDKKRAIEERSKQQPAKPQIVQPKNKNIDPDVLDLGLDPERIKSPEEYIPSTSGDWKSLFESSKKDRDKKNIEIKQDAYLNNIGKQIGLDLSIGDIKKDFGSIDKFLNEMFYPLYNSIKEHKHLRDETEEDLEDFTGVGGETGKSEVERYIEEIKREKEKNFPEMKKELGKYRYVVPKILKDIESSENTDNKSFDTDISEIKSMSDILRKPEELEILKKYIGDDSIRNEIKEITKRVTNKNFDNSPSNNLKIIGLYEDVLNKSKYPELDNISKIIEKFKTNNGIYRVYNDLNELLAQTRGLFEDWKKGSMVLEGTAPVSFIENAIFDIEERIESGEFSEQEVLDYKSAIKRELYNFFEESGLSKSSNSTANKSFEKCINTLDNISENSNDYLIRKKERDYDIKDYEYDEFAGKSGHTRDLTDDESFEIGRAYWLGEGVSPDIKEKWDDDRTLESPEKEYVEEPGFETTNDPETLKRLMSSTLNRNDFKTCKRIY